MDTAWTFLHCCSVINAMLSTNEFKDTTTPVWYLRSQPFNTQSSIAQELELQKGTLHGTMCSFAL
jgi:hypothetical protein